MSPFGSRKCFGPAVMHTSLFIPIALSWRTRVVFNHLFVNEKGKFSIDTLPSAACSSLFYGGWSMTLGFCYLHLLCLINMYKYWGFRRFFSSRRHLYLTLYDFCDLFRLYLKHVCYIVYLCSFQDTSWKVGFK